MFLSPFEASFVGGPSLADCRRDETGLKSSEEREELRTLTGGDTSMPPSLTLSLELSNLPLTWGEHNDMDGEDDDLGRRARVRIFVE